MAKILGILVISLWSAFHPLEAQNLLMSHNIMHGYIFPASVTAAVGESVHLKVLVSMNEDDRCLYRDPGSTEDMDVHAPQPSTFHTGRRVIPIGNVSDAASPFSVDPNECGIKVLNINHQDAGFWRLTITRGENLIRGIAMVNVIDVPTVPEPSDRDSITGLEEVTPAGTEYCYVLRDAERQTRDVPMHEMCSLRVTAMDPTGSGHWSIIAGVRGYMREMHFGINIEHKDEQIVPTIQRGPDFLVLMCQLRYSRQMIKFCRFHRVADNLGLNMLEGVGWDRYRYHGNGFGVGDCGLEIEEPDTIDRGLWKCVVGYGDDDMMKVSGAILDSSDSEPALAIIGVEDVNGLNGSDVTLQCNANKPLDYCWFKDPAGVIFSVSENLVQDEDTNYWYEGISLAMGDCGIKLKPATEQMAGRWSCHVGSSQAAALEVSSFINVRIGQSQIIGSVDVVRATLQTAMMLECASIPKNTPLKYCRFITPSGQAFSLDESVTSDAAILGNYYSNPNHNPKKGFCSLIVRSVSSDDVGQWICAGKIAGHTMEQYAAIEVSTGEPTSTDLSTASIIGMAFGGAAILIVAIGLGYYNFWRRIRSQATAVNQEIELQERNTAVSQRFSIASGSSTGSSQSKRSDSELRTS